MLKKYIYLLAILVCAGSAYALRISLPQDDRKIAQASEDTAVIVVDVQGCFTEFRNGSLAVPDSNLDYIGKVRKATQEFRKAGYKIYATQDWHPLHHKSFYTEHPGAKQFDVIDLHGINQVLWPPHCTQDTSATLLVDPALYTAVVKKGMNPEYDSYSGFKDDNGVYTELDALLKKAGIKNLIVYGIATDYCVAATALDGKQLGYNVVVVTDLSRGVATDTINTKIAEMKRAGIAVVNVLDPYAADKALHRID